MSTFLGLTLPTNPLITGILISSSMPLTMGIMALLNPLPIITQNKFPEPVEASSKKLAAGLLRFYGIRNISLALIGATVCLHGDARLLGKVAVAWSLTPLVDGLIAGSLNGSGWTENLPHWGVWLALSVTGAVLLAQN